MKRGVACFGPLPSLKIGDRKRESVLPLGIKSGKAPKKAPKLLKLFARLLPYYVCAEKTLLKYGLRV